MNCDFKTTQIGDVYRHRCRACGTERKSQTERYIRECNPPRPPYDTGDILHEIIRDKTGQDVSPGCGCRQAIYRMNQYGPAWAREHVDEITAVMLQEAEIRGAIMRLDVPAFGAGPNFAPFAAKDMVLKAIKISERRGKRK
jgi:hypothetical protein